jgi:hypothetical protein
MKHFQMTNVTCLKVLLDGQVHLSRIKLTKAQTQILRALETLPAVDQTVSREMHIMVQPRFSNSTSTQVLTRLAICDNMIQLRYLEDDRREIYDMFTITYIPDCLLRGPVFFLSQFRDLKQLVRNSTLDIEFDGASAHRIPSMTFIVQLVC